MADLYNSDLGGNSRKAIPTSRLGTRNLVWYSFIMDYNLLYGEAGDNFTPYNATNSLYHAVVETIQEAGELYHLGAPTTFYNDGFVFAIADNDTSEADPNPFNVVYDEGNIAKSSVYQALTQFFGSENGWDLYPCFDTGFGIFSGNQL